MSNCENKHNEGAKEPMHTPDAHTEQNDQGKQPTAPEDKIVQNNSTNHGDEGKNVQPSEKNSTKVATEAVKASKCGAPGLTPSEKEDCELEEKVKAAKKKDVDTAADQGTGSRQKTESTKPKDMTAGTSKKDDKQTTKETSEEKKENVEAAQKKKEAAKKKMMKK